MARVSRPRRSPSGGTLRFMQRVWELAHALDVQSKRMARDLGVTGPQRLVIRIVGQSPDLMASEIAAMMGLHPSTLTGILARLERQGLIQRTTDANDRRRRRLRLTAAGRRIDRERKGTVEASVRRALFRADTTIVTHAETMLELLAHELLRDE